MAFVRLGGRWVCCSASSAMSRRGRWEPPGLLPLRQDPVRANRLGIGAATEKKRKKEEGERCSIKRVAKVERVGFVAERTSNAANNKVIRAGLLGRKENGSEAKQQSREGRLKDKGRPKEEEKKEKMSPKAKRRLV
ncbi:uncharacterized protein SPSK_02824 [Sporothrix schenckii 1099-18]|uniref:Uncharacterized protein n=1 Tax=Sporothrix schenckii 1099-18 TaxID=1397361 RepID=A0A0F2MBE8_SPOSC|nr:uncharacterized protein SPSK_02824 [Sporothrix schenckii 1099-18]KJR86424.1 hypothetical protein SPSK_02824 [Sporothrix schenckii 1099-18]